MKRRSQNYRDGWFSAEGDYADLIPYDPNLWPGHVVDAEAEEWVQGYYDFWETKGFKL